MTMRLEWKKIGEEPMKVGFRKILRRTFVMPDGRQEIFDVKDEGKPVCILPMTSRGTIVLVKQYRPGPERVLLELPGGGMEPGETPEDAAQRELLEETGYEGDLVFVGNSLICAYSTGLRFNYVATSCEKVCGPSPDENEFLDVVEMPLHDFIKHLHRGELTDVTTGMLGLTHLGILTCSPDIV